MDTAAELLGRARGLDASDPLAPFRGRFARPRGEDGGDLAYFCGHSLGLMCEGVRGVLDEELATWAERGVEGHFRGPRPWFSYHERFSEPLARLAGALPLEVVAMGSLTTNLHLLCASFYRPTARRYRVVIEHGAFPSDLYAMQSQAAFHGHDPARAVLTVRPRDGESVIRHEDVERLLDEHGGEIALVLWPGVQYVTGQAFDLGRLARASHAAGAVFGADLAHAIGNVPLRLHEDGVDFAVWCSYKYLNAGPGAIGGAFVHERHARRFDLPRFAGWWGHDPATRFAMDEARLFVPQPGAAGWQLSNPPVLAAAPLLASLAVFDEAGQERRLAKTRAQFTLLTGVLDSAPGDRLEVLTPRREGEHGCQVSVRLPGRAVAVARALRREGFVVDVRPPDVIRIAPTPLCNTYEEVARVGARLVELAREGGAG